MFRCEEVVITKAREDDIAAIERLIRSVENQFKRLFLDYVRFSASDARLEQIVRFLEAGNQEVLNQFLSQTLRVYEGVIQDAVANAGKLQASLITPEIERAAAKIDAPIITTTFNVGDRRAAEIVQQQAGRFIREVTDTQRNVISTIVSESAANGEGAVTTARKIRDNIGLTSKQYESVKNYEAALRNGDKAALDRALRDRRFDGSVSGMDKKPLTEDQIKRMTDRYRERYVQYRAETIARTETGEAVNNGRQQAMLQNLEAVGLSENDVEKTWVSIRDKRTRWSHNHSGLGGKKVMGLNTAFISPTGARMKTPGDRSLGAGGGDVINCRCSVTYRIVPPS